MKISPIAVAFVLVLVGCTVPGTRAHLVDRPVTPSQELASVATVNAADYTYRLLTPEQTGLTQVFDDGRNTYLTFAGATPAGLMIFDENGRAVSFTTAGDTAMVNAVRGGLLIRTPTKSTYAQPRSPDRSARVEASKPGETDTTPWLPAELAAARAEILSAQHRLVGLSAELDKAARGEPAAPLAQIKSDIEEIRTELNGITATLVRAHFASGSTVLALSDSLKEAILAAARRADRVRIRGRADSSGSAAFNSQLALERALSVRRMLIEGGIAPEKLRTTYARADYIAPNTTIEGRAQNRRVDLVFISKSKEPIDVVANQPASESALALGSFSSVSTNTPTIASTDSR